MRVSPRLLSLTMAGILTAFLLMLIGWLLQESPPLQVRRLPDGTVLRLEAVTRGPQQRFVRGRNWQRLLVPLLPPSLQPMPGVSIYTYRPISPKNSSPLVFWISRSAKSSPNRYWWPRAVAFEEHGCEFNARRFPLEFSPPFGDTVQGWALPAFPRRGARVGLRLTDFDRSHTAVEFMVPNPTPGPYPTWSAAPPPITRRDGDLTFTLTRFLTGHAAPDRAPALLRERPWTHVTVRIRDNGGRTGKWEPVGITLSDATGNIVLPWMIAPGWMYYQADDEAHFAFPSNLSADESAWKLRLEFAPTSGYAPADLWTVRRVALPRSWGEERTTTVVATRHGASLNLRLQISRHPSLKGQLFVKVRVSPCVSGLRIGLLRATDAQGRPLARVSVQGVSQRFLNSREDTSEDRLDVVKPSGTVSSGDGYRSTEGGYQLKAPTNLKGLNLTFAVPKSRFVEFVAQPTRR
jgi:hypothetical protein